MSSQGIPNTGRYSAFRVNPSFKYKLNNAYSADTLKYCYQCGACSAVCPISKFIDAYKPNKIIESVKLGLRGLSQSYAFVFCSACTLCTKGCPQGVKVHEVMQGLKDISEDNPNFVRFLSKGFNDVVEALGQMMPFPITYSWICLLSPEQEPKEYPFRDIVSKAFHRVLSYNRELGSFEDDAKKVAVIGSGPAGLTAAWELANNGVAVTVFERQEHPGGMLHMGIPGYRLPKDVVEAEIDGIRALGVRIMTDTPVDRRLFDELTKSCEYAAVFIATGAGISRKPGFEGETLSGIATALDFLKAYNETSGRMEGEKVVVIGGGNVAIDAAGSAMRCGAESVKLFCLEDRVGMPAHVWEVQEAEAEGVEIHPSRGLHVISGDGEKITGVEVVRCISVFDESGRFNPTFDEKTIEAVEADRLIFAVGQSPDLSFLSEDIGVSRGAIQSDPYTMETSVKGVYAGGDAAAGTASLIAAISAGKTAARSILRYLEIN